MWRIPLFAFDQARWIALAVILATVLALPVARQVRVEVSGDALIPAASRERDEWNTLRSHFGGGEPSAVYAEDAALFSPARLARLRALHDRLAALPVFSRVESLFNLSDIRNENGILETGPAIASPPATPEAAAALRARVIANPLLTGQVVSQDGEATLFLLHLPDGPDAPPAERVTAAVEHVLAEFTGDFAALFYAGAPASETWLRRQLVRDQAVLLPLSLGVLFALLIFTLRSLPAAVFPILNAAIAVLWTGAAMAAIGLPVNPLNYILPALVLVIGATSDIHIIHEFREHLQTGASPRQAVEHAARRISLALALTSGTTILGFASTATSNVPILREFGIAAALAMTARFLVSILFLPACFRFAAPLLHGNRAPSRRTWPDRIVAWLDRLLFRHTRAVLAGLALLAAASIFLAVRIEVSNNFRAFFRTDSPVILNNNRLTARLPGLQVLNLTLHAAPGAFADPQALRQVAAIADFLRKQEGVDSVMSAAGLLARINGQIHDGDPVHQTVPATAAAVRQLLLFAHPAEYKSLLTPDLARANLVIRCHLDQSREISALAARIRAALDAQLFGPVVYSLGGRALLFAGGADSITWAQTLSLGGMMLSLFLIVGVLFLSWRCGALTVVANMLPVLAIFGAMGAAGITLNVGTCMVAAITLGIAVDDTMHLLVHFNREARRLKDERAGMRTAIRDELVPITATSLALGAGFAVLGLSSFQPVREFGLLSAGVMLVALATEMLVTPLFFGHTRVVTLWDIVGLHLRTALLAKSPFFEGLTPWQARKIILASDIEEHPPGSLVVPAGEPGARMYVVLSGGLEVAVGAGDARKTVATLGLGDIFGEMAFVSQRPRTADVVARTQARLLSLDYDSLLSLRRFSPYLVSQVLLNISRIISARLASTLESVAPKPA